MAEPFATMAGGEVLAYIRDAVVQTATYKKTYLEQSAAVGGAPVTSEELAEVRALEAAADAIRYALTVGQDAKAKGKPPPEWVLRMASQARIALTEPAEQEEKAT